MGTRATYLIRVRKQWENFNICFYNHWDNYPEGAANLLTRALEQNWSNQCNGKNLAKRLASLDGPEIVLGHEEVGDSDYRYDITEGEKDTNIIAYEATNSSEEMGWLNNWKVIFNGSLQEFIEKYTK